MTRPRAYLVISALVAMMVVAGAAAPAQADGLRGRMLQKINRVRVNHDLHRLKLNLRLSHDAHTHSRRMAKRNEIFHTSNLASRVSPYNATSWGENVAKAGTLRRTKVLWMHSSEHRYNMLHASYRRAGVGVVSARGWLWVTVIFYG
jgi:uncharacterized protein YkwD